MLLTNFANFIEHMLSTGRIDIVASTSRFIYVMELKLANNGGINAAEKQIIDNDRHLIVLSHTKA